jgi:hypothetical protein
MDKKIKIAKPDQHLIVDPIAIALLEYMPNLTTNPDDLPFFTPVLLL